MIKVQHFSRWREGCLIERCGSPNWADMHNWKKKQRKGSRGGHELIHWISFMDASQNSNWDPYYSYFSDNRPLRLLSRFVSEAECTWLVMQLLPAGKMHLDRSCAWTPRLALWKPGVVVDAGRWCCAREKGCKAILHSGGGRGTVYRCGESLSNVCGCTTGR